MPHFSRTVMVSHSSVTALVVLTLLAGAACAAEVGVVGLFPGKAVLVIDGGGPRTLAVGAKTPEGVKLLSVDENDAVVEVAGKRHRIGIGQQVYSSSAAAGGGVVTLNADGKGHFSTIGTVNGASVRFIVDTGATFVSLGAADARRASIDYAKGEPGAVMTANGVARAWRVKLNSVRVGEVVLTDVDGAVQENDLPVVLLGMSFLNRMDMERNGETMTLRKRY
jgi:aspartyl protease family protein